MALDPDRRYAAQRGLPALAGGLVAALALSLLNAALFWWMTNADPDSMAVVRFLSDWGPAVLTLTILLQVVTTTLIAAGAVILARAFDRARVWAYLALGGAVAQLAMSLLMHWQRAHWNESSGGIAPFGLLLWVCALLLWSALGLLQRDLFRAAGRRVPAWAAILWSMGVAWDVLVGVAQRTGLLRGGQGEQRLFYIVGLAILLSRLALILASRRALARPGDASEGGFHGAEAGGAWQAHVAEGLGIYRGGLIARLAIAILAVAGAVVAGGASGSMLVGIFAVLAESVAEVAMVVGVVRCARHLPVGRAGTALAAFFLGAASLLQLYTANTLWHILDYSQLGAGTSLWSEPGMGGEDLLTQAERLPQLVVIATSLALIGFFLILGSLRWLATYVQQPALAARVTAISIGAGLLTLVSAGLQYHVATSHHPAVRMVLLLGLIAVAGAVTLFVLYIQLLASLMQVLRDGGPTVAQARVVSRG